MIVEFFGVPGGGKTTLLREMVRRTPRAQEIKLISRKEVVWGTMRFFFHHPVSFFVWVMVWVWNARGLFRYKLGLLCRSMAARAQAERLSNSGIIYIDEGLMQRILSLFEVPLGKKNVSFLLRHTPMPHMVVNVQGGNFSRFTLEEDRLNSPRARRGQARLEAWMEIVRANAGKVEEMLPLYTQVVGGRQGQSALDPQAILSFIEKIESEVNGS